MLADLHLHSKFSDGSDTTEELVEKLLHNGITTFSLTDHDTVAGLPSLLHAVGSRARVITGIEFSCTEIKKNCHILGFGFAPDAPSIHRTLAHGQELRRENFRIRLAHLEQNHGIRFTEEEIAWLNAQNSISRAHIMKLLVQHGYAESYQDGMRKYLNGCKDREVRLTPKEAIAAILEAGAIPVWAHPLGGEGEAHESPEKLLPALLSYGIMGLECYYSRYTPEECANLVSLANRHNLLISGGSDYHGTNKTVKLGTLCADGTPIPAEKLTLLGSL